MDYTVDAIDLPVEALKKSFLNSFGPLKAGNSQFLPENLLDSLVDRRNYALTRPNLEAVVQERVRPRPWVAEVSDCDSRSVCMASDLIDAALDLGWKFGLAMLQLWYLSKTAGLPHVNRMDGYHCALAITEWEPRAGTLSWLVVQPPTLHLPSRIITPAIYARPEDEVKWTVFAVGVS